MENKNLSASVKARLLNLARQRGENFNLVLLRYGIERLLYRISQSRYSGKFLLKGAMLYALWDAVPYRPTRDLDLLGFLPAEVDSLRTVFSEIATTAVEPDGLFFEPDSITAESILEDADYGGVRIRINGWLGAAKVPVQIDVGSGDVVTPSAEQVNFPVMLDFPAPVIRAYPIYTVAAEKIEAACKLKVTNSRMKDFFDLWFIFHRFDINRELLQQAIVATFNRRGAALPIDPEPFTDSLANDPVKQIQWAAFLRRNKLRSVPDNFPEVVLWLREFLRS